MAKTKQWKKGGEQDKFITKLIKQGKINKNTKPAALKAEFPNVFGDFSSNVMRNHLNVLKMSNGLFIDGEADDDNEDDELEESKEGAIDNVTAESSGASFTATTFGPAFHGHFNYPILCNVFKDPDNQFEKVVLAVLMPSGVKNVRVELSDDGMAAIVKYVWPKTMFTMEDLFKKQLEQQFISPHHPKVLCIQEALEKVRKRVDMCPEAMIKVALPIRVQTAIDSWTKGGLKREDGTKIAYGEFKGYIKEYNKKLNDSQLVYDL